RRHTRLQGDWSSDVCSSDLIAMCLDECPGGAADVEVLREAVRRTIVWAERCRAAHRRPEQALFAIVQGSTDIALRTECAEKLVKIGRASCRERVGMSGVARA